MWAKPCLRHCAPPYTTVWPAHGGLSDLCSAVRLLQLVILNTAIQCTAVLEPPGTATRLSIVYRTVVPEYPDHRTGYRLASPIVGENTLLYNRIPSTVCGTKTSGARSFNASTNGAIRASIAPPSADVVPSAAPRSALWCSRRDALSCATLGVCVGFCGRENGCV